jgi:hypothetical protein
MTNQLKAAAPLDRLLCRPGGHAKWLRRLRRMALLRLGLNAKSAYRRQIRAPCATAFQALKPQIRWDGLAPLLYSNGFRSGTVPTIWSPHCFVRASDE